MEIHPNEDGSKSVLIDAVDKSDVLNALSKSNIEILDLEDVTFDAAGNVLDVAITVRGADSDISFAIDSIVKMIRPYPKGFIHKKRI